MKTEENSVRRYIVIDSILPEAIVKTAETKELLNKTPELTINEAVRQVGISRSAFYKYRDGIFPFYEATKEKLITIQIQMDHQSGVLSNCLNTIADAGANILTINQGIPLQGLARVTIAFELHQADSEEGKRVNQLELLLEGLYEINGVVKVELVGQN